MHSIGKYLVARMILGTFFHVQLGIFLFYGGSEQLPEWYVKKSWKNRVREKCSMGSKAIWSMTIRKHYIFPIGTFLSNFLGYIWYFLSRYFVQFLISSPPEVTLIVPRDQIKKLRVSQVLSKDPQVRLGRLVCQDALVWLSGNGFSPSEVRSISFTYIILLCSLFILFLLGRIDTIMMYWTSVFFVGHVSLPILAGLALAIAPVIPKRPKVQEGPSEDLGASPENLSAESFKSNQGEESKPEKESKKQAWYRDQAVAISFEENNPTTKCFSLYLPSFEIV